MKKLSKLATLLLCIAYTSPMLAHIDPTTNIELTGCKSCKKKKKKKKKTKAIEHQISSTAQ